MAWFALVNARRPMLRLRLVSSRFTFMSSFAMPSFPRPATLARSFDAAEAVIARATVLKLKKRLLD
ncbi:hypothetical protein AB4851_17740 [Burkholderia sp. 22PA0099]|uniref:hypothetical protein n=1 Tax=Burkholderia sp. 22PA0099 TaxID=3237372 RepID=UPI0039C23FF6